MATIANNHLSELAKKGRGGDTEIVQTPSGKIWHVTPEEKELITLYGSEGEKLVDAVGSGTINPETGLEEKFILEAAAIVGAGIGLYSAWKSGSTSRDQAGYEQASAESGLAQLDTADENLENTVQKKRESALLEHRQNIENISEQTGVAVQDLEQQTAEAIQKTGMATHGGVTGKSSQMWDRIYSSFERGKEGLMSDLGKKMGELEGWYEGQKARLVSERSKFNNQIDFAKKKQDSWYFGKHVEDAWNRNMT